MIAGFFVGRQKSDRESHGRCGEVGHSVFEEVQQILIEAILVRVGQAMWRTRIDDQLGVFDLRGSGFTSDVEWHDLIVITVDQQGGHVEFLQILAEVRGRERGDGVVG